MYELFERCGVTHETADVCMGQCEKALSLLNIGMGCTHVQCMSECVRMSTVHFPMYGAYLYFGLALDREMFTLVEWVSN